MKRAFTLIEMVVSLSILSIVFLAMGSVMMLATKAIPSAQDPVSQTVGASDVIQQLYAELQTATGVQRVDPDHIEFTVPDRDGDGAEESISYLWGGAGGSLMRGYNGGGAVTMLNNVQYFVLAYDTVQVSQPDALVESTEAELAKYDSPNDLSDAHVHHDVWWGQYFKPALPADAVEWSVTRVLFYAEQDNDNAPMDVKLCLPIAGNSQPSSNVVDSTVMPSNTLTNSLQWITVSFTNAKSISPTTGLYVTFSSDLYRPAKLRYQTKNVVVPDLQLAQGGPLWSWSSAANDQSLLFYVYGTYSTLQPQPPIDILDSVTLTINLTNDPAMEIRTTVSTLNQPEIP